MADKSPKQMRNNLLGQKVVKGLASRNFEAYYCETSKEAIKKALELIPEESSISWGGTMTVRDMGLAAALHKGNYQVFDRDQASSPEEEMKILRKALELDYFITSTNAISEDGILVNIDGTGNRLAAMCFGPQNVLVVAGINKVCSTEAAAMDRARTYAAPVNQMRFMRNTPCSVTGSCSNCKTDDCICCQILTTRMSRPAKRIKVILVGEELGY